MHVPVVVVEVVAFVGEDSSLTNTDGNNPNFTTFEVEQPMYQSSFRPYYTPKRDPTSL